MKSLKDLKEEILDNKLQHFYVFYGEDYGLRHHYIHEIARRHFNNKISYIPDFDKYLRKQSGGKGLFDFKSLYVVHGEVEFAKSSKYIINTFLEKLSNDTVILCLEEELPNSLLWKEYEQYITYFPCVDDKIAYQFIDSEISLDIASKKELARNCENNYNNILLESDKIKNYAQAKNINEQEAYNELESKNQLIYKYETFHSYEFMNDVLQGNISNINYWYNVIKSNFLDEFWIATESIFNDYLIAYFIVKEGKWNGSTKAYELGLYWSRIKTIREFKIPYSDSYLIDTAYKVAKLDADIKLGKIEQTKVLDYFLTIIF